MDLFYIRRYHAQVVSRWWSHGSMERKSSSRGRCNLNGPGAITSVSSSRGSAVPAVCQSRPSDEVVSHPRTIYIPVQNGPALTKI